MSHHAVTIEKNADQVRPSPASSADLMQGLNLGDTVSFSSPHGKIRIHIVDAKTNQDATPFQEPNSTLIESNSAFTVKNRGLFTFRCSVKGPNDKDFVGWAETPAGRASGVDVPVPPPRTS
jgi:hypothetical protein